MSKDLSNRNEITFSCLILRHKVVNYNKNIIVYSRQKHTINNKYEIIL